MKKAFKTPLVFLTTAELNDIGGKTGQGWVDSLKPLPMSFEEWTASSYYADLDGNSSVNFEDYTKWWNTNGFGEESLMIYNPGLAATEEVVPDIETDVLGEDIVG